MENGLISVMDALRTQSFAVADGLVPEDALLGLLHDIRSAPGFRPAGIGRGERFALAPTVRSDRLLWMDPDALTAAQAALFARLDSVRVALNRTFFLGLRHSEGHLTEYPPGGHYEKHIDQFANQAHRLVSWVLYLNRTWNHDWGGQLRLYAPHAPSTVVADVEPAWGRLVLFWSDVVPHEVLATRAPRLSATGWFRTDDP